MKTVTKVLYEAMFLVDSAEAASDWDGINQLISGILEKFGAEIISSRKWDECKLAYEVKGKSRGTYILCYFRIEGAKIQQIERSVQLSERIMRVLILNAEHMTQEDIDKATPATLATERAKTAAAAAEKAAEEAAEEAAKKVAEEADKEVLPEIKEDLDVEESVVVDVIESEMPPADKSEAAAEEEKNGEVSPEIKEDLDVEKSVVVDAIESEMPADKSEAVEAEEESGTREQEEE